MTTARDLRPGDRFTFTGAPSIPIVVETITPCSDRFMFTYFDGRPEFAGVGSCQAWTDNETIVHVERTS